MTTICADAAFRDVIRLVIVEDEALVRRALAALVSRTPGLECVATAADHATAVREASLVGPQLALIDTSTISTTGGPALQMWRECLPKVRLLLIDDLIRDVHVRLVIKKQADGYVTKRDAFGDVVEVIRRCAQGETAFTPTLLPRLRKTALGWEIHAAHGVPGLHLLTPRETEVLVYLAQGLTVKHCSELLKISPSTVDNHKSRIMRKLKMHKIVELTRFALREGLIPR